MQNFNAPLTRRDFVIIVDSNQLGLLASVISYLQRQNEYLPIFLCHSVDVAKDSPVIEPDIYAIQRRRSDEFCVFVNNAIIENGGCENLIFLGLSDNQKSFLDSLRLHYEVLEIEDSSDVEPYLGGFSWDKKGYFDCGAEQFPQALFYAVHHNLKLRDSGVEVVIPIVAEKDWNGIVIIENTGKADMVMAISYAFTIGANLQLVDPLQNREKDEILHLIEGWESDDGSSIIEIRNRINIRIGGIDMATYTFATFFTEGLPYPLCLPNLACSMVNLEYRPDFFVFNTIISEQQEKKGSAAIFSPSFFVPDEEVDSFTSLFEHHHLYLRRMLGKGATVGNLRNTIELYPIDILHICSHGGAVKGHLCRVRFSDKKGTSHVVEFDHILSIGKGNRMDGKLLVESIYHFKSLNGFRWQSVELHAQGYPHELYASLLPEISKAFHRKKVQMLGEVPSVSNSNSISCEVFNYSANFDQFTGSHSHPLIFNNSCWSWMVISNNFLAAGARGYLGTLKVIGNKEAVAFARNFYDRLFDGPIIKAFQYANEIFMQDNPDPIYVYWGLHFSSFGNNNTVTENKRRIFLSLFESLKVWWGKFLKKEGAAELVLGNIFGTRHLIDNLLNGDESGHTLR